MKRIPAFQRAFVATVVFAVVHSALASLTAKKGAGRLAGERNRNGLYRVFYLAQSFVTFAALTLYISRLPEKKICEIRGEKAALLHGGQAAMLLYLTWSALAAGLGQLTGLTHFSRVETKRACSALCGGAGARA